MALCNSSTDRVRRNTPDSINARIHDETNENIARFAAAGSLAIDRRLDELSREWDIERCLETVAPSITLLGILLGITTNRRWFVLPGLVQTFLLQHAVQGWCPPLPLLRSLGIRTTNEIDVERNALKALRGDYRQVNGEGASQSEGALEAACK